MAHSGSMFKKDSTSLNVEPLCGNIKIQGIAMLASIWAHIRWQECLNSEHQNKQTNQQIEVIYLMAHSGSMFNKISASLNVEPLSGIHTCLKRVQDQTT
mgnify:CR=1 FL=1